MLPSRTEDWREFSYDDLASFVEELSDVIRGNDPRHAVLVAEMSWWWGERVTTGVSPWHIYRATNIVGFDVYPEKAADAHYFALNADMLARYWDKPVWVTELNRKDGRPEAPDIREFVRQAVDYGASGIFYFSGRDHAFDGGNYGLLDHFGQPKPQFAAFGETVLWLRERVDTLLAGLPPPPDVYLIWPKRRVANEIGHSSPAWRVNTLATRLQAEGRRVGLIEESNIGKLPESAQVIEIAN